MAVPPCVGLALAVTGQVCRLAVQVSESLPPCRPVQLQLHGPVPVTLVALPTLHRLPVGWLVNTPPWAAPQAPATGAAAVVNATGPASALNWPEASATR